MGVERSREGGERFEHTLAVFFVALAFDWGKGAGAALRPDCLGGCH